MRIAGEAPPKPNTREVYLPRGETQIRLVLSPMPLGLEEHIRNVFPPPPAVREYEFDARGGIARGPDNKPLERFTRETASWTTQAARQNLRKFAVLVREGLRHDPDIQFDADGSPGKPTEENHFPAWTAYADALLKEFEAANFTADELVFLVNELAKLTVPTEASIREARERFYRSRGIAPATGPSLEIGADLSDT